MKLAYHYSDSPLRISRRKYVNKFNFKETDIPRMAFATPYSLLTWSSLEDLNQRLETPVSEINFRANLVIGPDEKIPYIEDQWRKRLRYEYIFIFRITAFKIIEFCLFIFILELGMKSYCVMPNLVIDVWLPRLTQRLENYTKKESL